MVLYDFNNVLNAYPMEVLQEAADTVDQPYAIVSLLRTEGRNYLSLRERAIKTRECIVALSSKIRENRAMIETNIKYKIIKMLHWKNVMCALDDKPHEWQGEKSKEPEQLKLDVHKKPVYLIKFD